MNNSQPTVQTRATWTWNDLRTLLAVTLGNAFEFYDFTVYSFFAAMIGNAFFPVTSPATQVMLSVAAFGAGFLSRPLGAAVIGAYADRAGSKKAMMLTISLMALGTAMIGLTPTYHSIGMLAPLTIVAGRLIQGFSAGGEAGPATTYMLVVAPRDRIGLSISLQLATQGAAALVAGLIGTLLADSMSRSQLFAWGWRIPFAMGLLIVPVGIFMRRNLAEGTAVKALSGRGQLLRRHTERLVLGVVMMMGPTMTAYVVGHYMVTFGLVTLHLPTQVALAAGLVGGISSMIGAVIGGLIYDRWRRIWPTVLPLAISAALCLPLYLATVRTHAAAAFFATVIILSVLRVLTGPLQLILLPQLFPEAIRNLALSLCYALSATLFGGSSQFIVAALLQRTGDPLCPAYVVLVADMLSLVAALITWRLFPTTLPFSRADIHRCDTGEQPVNREPYDREGQTICCRNA